MPMPKDPEEARLYRERQSERMKESHRRRKAAGIKVNQHTTAPETKAKMSASQKARITPEERNRRSDLAKNNGHGKWMKGKTRSPETLSKLSEKRKGKTYAEIYGEDRAYEERLKRSAGNKRTKAGTRPAHFLKSQKETADKRRGKTYEEIYGKDRAKEELQKRSSSRKRRGFFKRKGIGRLKFQGGDSSYVKWRTRVFERDQYTCQRCHVTGGNLRGHHIKSWKDYPKLRYDISNGMTLCAGCHREVHREQGDSFYKFVR